MSENKETTRTEGPATKVRLRPRPSSAARDAARLQFQAAGCGCGDKFCGGCFDADVSK